MKDLTHYFQPSASSKAKAPTEDECIIERPKKLNTVETDLKEIKNFVGAQCASGDTPKQKRRGRPRKCEDSKACISKPQGSAKENVLNRETNTINLDTKENNEMIEDCQLQTCTVDKDVVLMDHSGIIDSTSIDLNVDTLETNSTILQDSIITGADVCETKKLRELEIEDKKHFRTKLEQEINLKFKKLNKMKGNSIAQGTLKIEEQYEPEERERKKLKIDKMLSLKKACSVNSYKLDSSKIDTSEVPCTKLVVSGDHKRSSNLSLKRKKSNTNSKDPSTENPLTVVDIPVSLKENKLDETQSIISSEPTGSSELEIVDDIVITEKQKSKQLENTSASKTEAAKSSCKRGKSACEVEKSQSASNKGGSNAFKLMMTFGKKVKSEDIKLEQKKTMSCEVRSAEKKKQSEVLSEGKKRLKKEKQNVDIEENIVIESVRKRKRSPISNDEEDDMIQEIATQIKDCQKNNKSSGLYTYFSPVSKDEALKKTANLPLNKIVCAEIHNAPSIPSSERKNYLGPTRRPQRISGGEEADKIIVISDEDIPVQKKPFKFKTPEKKKKRPQWKLKIKLLSPVKPLEDSTDDSSETDNDELEILDISSRSSPKQKCQTLAPIFLPRHGKTDTEISSTVPSKSIRKIISSVPMPPIRAAPTEHTIGFAEVDPETPLSVLYPSISHVTQLNDTQHEIIFDSVSVPPDFNPVSSTYITPPGTFTNTSANRVSAKLSHWNSADNDIESGEVAWCELYRPKCSSEVAGNAKSVQQLKVWLEGWKQRVGAAVVQVTQQSDSVSDNSDYDSSDDFIVFDESDSNEEVKQRRKRKHCNTAFLVGPCGSGKTAAVYAVADELGFKVLEMNASSRRSGKRILLELQEATQSHQVRNTVDQETLNSFFSNTNKNNKKDKVNDALPGNNIGLSLILVEDVDVVFEEQDEGFLAALNILAASSKRPLILVSNDPQCSLLLSRQHYLYIKFNKIFNSDAAPVILKMCQDARRNVGHEQLARLLQECNGDLRRAVLMSQTWALSVGFPQIPNNSIHYPLDLSKLWLNMSSTTLPYIVLEEETEENPTDDANTTWNSGIDDEYEEYDIFPKKKIFKRNRLTSDSSNECTTNAMSTWPSNLQKMQWLFNILATVDVLQGSELRPLVSKVRPGLSDQECYDSPCNDFNSEIQHWLAEKALSASSVNLGCCNLEEIEKWRRAHLSVDEELMEQLPVTAQLEHKIISVDLLPALRSFGRTDQYSARSSRRSKLNALNSIGFSLSPVNTDNLQFVFPDT